ncbi:MAG: cytochrome c biogenesis protein CcdA [Methanomicrobium sp.]|nr:cytochrome c biogenesis protein CcdA [Methanomicrobium sp.]
MVSADAPQNQNYDNPGITNKTVSVFYNKYCSACHRVIPVIEEISKKYPNVKIFYYDTYNSSENLTLLNEFGEKYNIPFPAYPIVFTGDSVVLQGVSSITANLDEVIKSVDTGLIPNIAYEKRWIKTDENTKTSSAVSKKEITIPLVLAAGLIDGINPCAFAVLIFLLISLMSAKSRKNILITGVIYTFAVYIFYILAGLGLMSFVQFTGISYIFAILAGIIAITAGIINIFDAILEKSPVSLSIPRSLKGIIGTISKKSSIPAAFLLGILVGIFELPCTGGIYLAIISLLSSEMTFYEGLPYLILYNCLFVLPLLLITIAVYLGLSPDIIDEYRINHRKLMKIIIGLILIFIGIIVIFWQI